MPQSVQEKKFLSTLREDNWWIGPLLVLFGLLFFIVYSTWAAWQGEYFWWSGAVNAEGLEVIFLLFILLPYFLKKG